MPIQHSKHFAGGKQWAARMGSKLLLLSTQEVISTEGIAGAGTARSRRGFTQRETKICCCVERRQERASERGGRGGERGRLNRRGGGEGAGGPSSDRTRETETETEIEPETETETVCAQRQRQRQKDTSEAWARNRKGKRGEPERQSRETEQLDSRTDYSSLYSLSLCAASLSVPPALSSALVSVSVSALVSVSVSVAVWPFCQDGYRKW
eukprot:2329491-Rhodomonas_salina.1